ncbi:MAG: TetR/AcrR family transcriptional regulator [Sphingomonadaceae bacterium]|nr:TetR/AcrR family transcriptional regulator [Sphingomonadaceae bacterium]
MTTREKLILTATRLFAERGYNATGMADILAEAGVHRGSLYHAFPAKQNLLLAVLERYRSGIEERLIAPAWEGVEDPIERVFALLGRYRLFLIETGGRFGCPIGSLALELHEADAEVRAMLQANFEAWLSHVAQCFVAAGDRLPADADRNGLALLTLTTMEGAVMLARTAHDLGPFDRALAQLRDYVDRLLAAAAA